MSNEPQIVKLRMWSCAGTAASQRCRGRPRCACSPAYPSSHPQDTALALCEIPAPTPPPPTQTQIMPLGLSMFPRPQLLPVIARKVTGRCAGLRLRRGWHQVRLRVMAGCMRQVCGVARGGAAGPGACRPADQLRQGGGAPHAGAEVCAAGPCEPLPPSAVPCSGFRVHAGAEVCAAGPCEALPPPPAPLPCPLPAQSAGAASPALLRALSAAGSLPAPIPDIPLCCNARGKLNDSPSIESGWEIGGSPAPWLPWDAEGVWGLSCRARRRR